MKRIGLIGGMSWESTAVYYRRLNEEVRRRLGGLRSAEIVLRSVDFHEVVLLQKAGEWRKAGAVLARAARDLEAGGAEMVLICTNTMHILADEVAAAVAVPLLHIADVTGDAIVACGHNRPLLLATRYTMEQPFYRERLKATHGLDLLVPGPEDRALVHEVIFEELCRGVAREASREAFRAVIRRGAAEGADCVILGCTEIGLLIGQADSALPVFDTTLLHADAAVGLSLGDAGFGAAQAAA